MTRGVDILDQNKILDTVIIGGGISGAAIVYELALKGISVALFEKSDYGNATSGATSKLIHGGLRYLKNMEFGLVRESLRERRILADIASNFVHPLAFLIPNKKGNLLTRAMLKSGMILYDGLGFDKKDTKDKGKALSNHSVTSISSIINEEPILETSKYDVATIFYDYQNFSPERLTLSFINSAQKKGAYTSNYTQVKNISKTENGLLKVTILDIIKGEEKDFFCKSLVNATGTWVDEVIDIFSHKKNNHKLKRSEGIHVVVDKIVNNHVISFQTKEGRHFMIMPWRDKTLIGTTDFEYAGSADNYKVTKQSLDEIIENVNDFFGSKKMTYSNILYSYGGLRPLIDDENNSYNASRKHEIINHSKTENIPIITVEGGKYTTSRNLAVDVSIKIEKLLGLQHTESHSEKYSLIGSEISNFDKFESKLLSKYSNDFKNSTISYIAKSYGTIADDIFKLALNNTNLKEELTSDGEILAEIEYAIENESVFTLEDVLFRRTGICQIGKPSNDTLNKIATMMQKKFSWDSNRKQKEINNILSKYKLPLSDTNI